MIDKKELRSGNIVNVPHGDIVIDFLMQEGVHLVDGCGGNWQSLEPVPLSPEWLERLGFKDSYGGSYLENPTPYNFVFVNGGTIFYKAIPIKCQYVHTFQNIYYAIIGEELTIKP